MLILSIVIVTTVILLSLFLFCSCHHELLILLISTIMTNFILSRFFLSLFLFLFRLPLSYLSSSYAYYIFDYPCSQSYQGDHQGCCHPTPPCPLLLTIMLIPTVVTSLLSIVFLSLFSLLPCSNVLVPQTLKGRRRDRNPSTLNPLHP